MGKSSKDKRDVYYRLAKEQGYRARSAYKLKDLHAHFDLFTPDVCRVLDLCAAPGSWSQVIIQALDDLNSRDPRDRRLLGVDLQPISPLPGAQFIQADITEPSTLRQILHSLDGYADLVVCDGAPDVTGVHTLDIFMQQQLLNAALTMTTACLRIGGNFVAKLFTSRDGRDVAMFFAQCELFFTFVKVLKPDSSRESSFEHFIVCMDFAPPEGEFKRSPEMPLTVGSRETFGKFADFMAHGDLSLWTPDDAQEEDEDITTNQLLQMSI